MTKYVTDYIVPYWFHNNGLHCLLTSLIFATYDNFLSHYIRNVRLGWFIFYYNVTPNLSFFFFGGGVNIA